MSVLSIRNPFLLRRLMALALPILFAVPTHAQQAGGVADSGARVQLVRAVVGAKGEQREGTFVMTDPRSTFYVPDDREVIVYFVWQGALGTHHCEGSVRGPDGQFATMSSFNYNATQPRFAGFWRMPLSDSATAGIWVFEAHVDGEVAGQVSFQVVPGTKPVNLPAERVLPTTAEIYKLAVAASVAIESLDSTGKTMKQGSGIFFKEGLILTSFRVIEGASSLKIHLANGQQVPVTGLLAWNRRQDWAVFGAGSSSQTPLRIADAKSWTIGDRCFWLDVNPDGSRIIRDGQVVGLESPYPWGDRINISGIYNRAGVGGPLLNEQGQLIGVLGGTLPGALLLDPGSDIINTTPDLNMSVLGGIAVAANLLPASVPAAAKPLAELASSGEMMPFVSDSKIVAFGLLSDGPKPGEKPNTVGQHVWKSTFQKRDNSAAVIIDFANNANVKATVTLMLYDLDNHVIATGKPEKLNIGKGQSTERTWGVPFTNLNAGYYRLDVVIGDGVAWRQFFRLTD